VIVKVGFAATALWVAALPGVPTRWCRVSALFHRLNELASWPLFLSRLDLNRRCIVMDDAGNDQSVLLR
jgi:hypothetical protein